MDYNTKVEGEKERVTGRLLMSMLMKVQMEKVSFCSDEHVMVMREKDEILVN